MNIALLTAAGTGTRMHMDIPKQFLHVNNKPIIIYTMEAFQKHPSIDYILVATLDQWRDVLWAYARQFHITKLRWVITGGSSGQESIRNGLDTIKQEVSAPDVVVTVHDGNRPMVTSEVISDNLAAFKKHGNAVAAIPCTEVVFESEDGLSSKISIPREKLFRTQTPHTYRLDDLLWAHKEAEKKGIKGTAASCMLMKELGRETYFSKGSEKNLKITTRDDLEIFKALLEEEKHNLL